MVRVGMRATFALWRGESSRWFARRAVADDQSCPIGHTALQSQRDGAQDERAALMNERPSVSAPKAFRPPLLQPLCEIALMNGNGTALVHDAGPFHELHSLLRGVSKPPSASETQAVRQLG